jgi:hypothetical protein
VGHTRHAVVAARSDRLVTVTVVSEYQYYEFAAVDRPLGARDLDALRGLSTRAHITPTSLVNTYQWGSFKGDPRRLVERYFDAFLYLANWGTRELMMRLPVRPGYDFAVDLLVDLREVCDPAVFASRVATLRREHGRKVAFVERLEHAGL